MARPHNIARSEYKNADEFFDFLVKECDSVLKDNQYLTVAFLAYDYNNPEIVKMLKDKELYQSLDYETGNVIMLFYIDTDSLSKNNKIQKNSYRGLFPRKGIVASLTRLPLPINETPLSIASCLLLKLGYTKYGDIHKLPFVIFLHVNKTGQMVDNVCVQMKYKEREVKAAYEEMMDLIERVTSALRNVNRFEADRDAIFNIVDNYAKQSIFKTYKGQLLSIWNLVSPFIMK